MNQFLHFGREAWSTRTALRDPPPMNSESLAVPPDHGVGLDDDQNLPPVRPEPAEGDPEGSIDLSKPGLVLRLGVDGQLLTKGKLDQGLPTAASEEGDGRAEKYRDQSQESFHGMEILRDIELQQQSDSARNPAVPYSTGLRARDRNHCDQRTDIEDAQPSPSCLRPHGSSRVQPHRGLETA
jgi:hypothetical protein